MRALSEARIARMNEAAQNITGENNTDGALATIASLNCLQEIGRSGGCVLYGTARGGWAVNCWTTAAECVSDFGFDDNIEAHSDQDYYPR